MSCTNIRHDHQDHDVNGDLTGQTMVCSDCKRPAHYDTFIEQYQHDEARTDCFLIHWDRDAESCTTD